MVLPPPGGPGLAVAQERVAGQTGQIVDRFGPLLGFELGQQLDEPPRPPAIESKRISALTTARRRPWLWAKTGCLINLPSFSRLSSSSWLPSPTTSSMTISSAIERFGQRVDPFDDPLLNVGDFRGQQDREQCAIRFRVQGLPFDLRQQMTSDQLAGVIGHSRVPKAALRTSSAGSAIAVVSTSLAAETTGKSRSW